MSPDAREVSSESAMIALLQRNLLSLFCFDRQRAIEASQCVADQIRTLVTGSRGEELMGLIYSDPYARILELIEGREAQLMLESRDFGVQGVSI